MQGLGLGDGVLNWGFTWGPGLVTCFLGDLGQTIRCLFASVSSSAGGISPTCQFGSGIGGG